MMKTNSRKTLCLALALLSFSPALRADDAKNPDPGSSHLGLILSLGLGGTDDGSLIGAASAQAVRRSRLFGVRIASASRFEIFGDSPTPSNTEYSVLYGRYNARRKGYTSLSAGLSVVSALRRGRLLHVDTDCFIFCSSQYERVVTRTVGIPFEAKAVLGKGVGVGFTVLGNLNPKGSFIGLGITLELGSLR